MYHIKNDKRMITSARMISEAFDECMEKKAFDNITITEILLRAKVSRSTFYRIFDSTVDILIYQCDKAFEDILENLKLEITDNMTVKEIIVKYTAAWLDNYKLAETIVNANRMEILFHSNNKYIKDIISTVSTKIDFSDMQFEYMASALSAVFVTWIRTGKKSSPEELVQSLSQIIIRLANLF